MSGPDSDDEPVFFEDTPADAILVTADGAPVRPSGLTFICVLALVLGSAGLLIGCTTMASQVFASGVQNTLAGMSGGANQQAVEIQKEMNARALAITARYKWVTLPLVAIKIFVEAALLIAAIMSLGLKIRGRSWLLAALFAATVFEVIYVVPAILIQRETQAVMSEMMPKLMDAQQGANKAPPGLNNVMSTFFSAVGVAAIVFALVWLAAKLAFYVYGIKYLNLPEVVSLFAPANFNPVGPETKTEKKGTADDADTRG